MGSTLGVRVVVLLVLFSLLFVLLVGYGSVPSRTEARNLPSEAELASDYQEYVGSPVSVTGEVVEMDPVVIKSHYSDGESIRFRVRGRKPDVTPGERMTVYGIAEPGHVIRAQSVLVQSPSGLGYMLAVSAAAALWVSVRLVRGWRFDPDSWHLEPRDEPLSGSRLWRWARSTFGGGSRADA